MKTIKLTLPLSVGYGKNKFILNFNNYRNTHYRKLDKAKNTYTSAIFALAKPIGFKIKKCELKYTVFRGTKISYDVSNVCSVIDKFTCDALTKRGYWEDDNYNVISKVTYRHGGYDKGNGRCELIIKIIE